MKTIKFIALLIFASFALLAFSDSAKAGSTIYNIADIANGDDCSSIGVWDAPSKTCVLTSTVNCGNMSSNLSCVTIADDDIVLNCKGNTITATSSGIGDGVSLFFGSNNTIKRCNIDGFDVGIDARTGSSPVIFYNNFTNIDGIGILLASGVNGSYVIGNTGDSSNFRLLLMSDTKNSYIIGNSSDGSNNGFFADGCTNDTFIANSADNVSSGIGFNITGCTRSEFINNSASNGVGRGFLINGGSRSTLLANISIDNGPTTTGNGFEVNLFVSGFNFEHNIADDNAFYGIRDFSNGKKTAGTANTYEANTCGGNGVGSSPAGLCTGMNP